VETRDTCCCEAKLLKCLLIYACRLSAAQNWNGATETVTLLSDDCWTVKLTSFEAFVSPTVTEMEPLHLSVRLFSLVDVVIIFSPMKI
jgi:hypothetical protein